MSVAKTLFKSAVRPASVVMVVLLGVSSVVSATVLSDLYRGEKSVPTPTTPNYLNFSNAVGLDNLITFSATPANRAGTDTAAAMNWTQNTGLCSQGGLPEDLCKEGIMGRISYALLKFPATGTYQLGADHDDQVEVAFSSTYPTDGTDAADYRNYTYGEFSKRTEKMWTTNANRWSDLSEITVAEEGACYAVRSYWNNQQGISRFILGWQGPGDASFTAIPEAQFLDISDPESYKGCAGYVDPGVDPDINAIPTLGEWAMILMAGLLGGLGAMRLRHRRKL